MGSPGAASGRELAGAAAVPLLLLIARIGCGRVSRLDWLQPLAHWSPVTLAANASRALALTGGFPASVGRVSGLLALFIPLSVWRYRRMS